MNVTAHPLRNRNFGNTFEAKLEDRWNYADYLKDARWRKDWISFDSLCHDPVTDTVFAGITSFDADIFWGWNRRKKRWFDAGYARVRNRYDAKFHRALVRDARNGCLYAAPALLHDIDRFWEAPGAAIVRYNPRTGDIAKLAIPMPHHYIQSIALDETRDMIYAQTFTPENLASYDLKTGACRWIGPTSSGLCIAQGENIELDERGGVWGGWSVTRAWQSQPGVDQYRLFRYDPNTERIRYFEKGLPLPDGAYGSARAEGFFNLGAGGFYVSGGGGGLYRLDTKTGKATFLFRAIGDEGRGRRSRLASLRLGPDGCAYGVTGRDGECELLRFDPKKQTFKLLGALKDSNTGATAWQIHDVCITPDGAVYAGENDHPQRSGYLWEIKL